MFDPKPGLTASGVRAGAAVQSLEPRRLLAGDVVDPALAAWFRADSIAAADGAPVASWADSSGRGFTATQPDAARRPRFETRAYDGRPAVRFSDAGDTSLLFNRPVSGDFSIVAVFASGQGVGRGEAWYGGAGLVDGEVPGVTDDFGLSLNARGQVLGGTGGPDTFVASGLGFNDGRPHVASLTRSASTGQLSLYVDGRLFERETGATGTLDAPGRLALGATLTGARHLTGDLFEVRIYNTVLADAARAALDAQLRAAYSVPPPPAAWFDNPVIASDFPDPGVLETGGSYYAFATNGGGRNVRAARSTDLVNWTFLSDALPDLPGWAQPGRTWAPDADDFGQVSPGVTRYNLYYTAWSRSADRQAIGVATATNPGGPYTPVGSTPLVAQFDQGGAIDPSVFAADDGSRYLLWKNDGNAVGQDTWIYIQRLSADGFSLVGQPTRLIKQDQPFEGPLVEGPTLWERDDNYYLFYSAHNFNDRRYATGYAVADSLLGPYVKPGDGPLMATEGAVVGAGGAEVVTGPDGNTWMLYHSWEGNFAYRSMSVDRLDWAGDVPVVRGPSRALQPVPQPARVADRRVFYNNSAADGNNPAADPADDNAVDITKSPLTPGGTVTPANVTAYGKGLNGVMVDVAGLPLGATLTPGDFQVRSTTSPTATTWVSGPAPRSVSIRPGAGAGGTDRVTLIWNDYAPGSNPANEAVANGWLEVTLKATANSLLRTASVFSFGNLIADANGDRTVGVADLGVLATHFGLTGPTPPQGDFTGDGRVDVADLGVLATRFGRSLSPPPGAALSGNGVVAPSATVATARADQTLRRRRLRPAALGITSPL